MKYTARQSRNGKFQIQNSRPQLPEMFARKTTNYTLVLRLLFCWPTLRQSLDISAFGI